MSIERFYGKNSYYILFLVAMETHIHMILIKNGHKWKNIILDF